MKSKKAVGLAVAAIVALNTVTVFANDTGNIIMPVNNNNEIRKVMPVKGDSIDLEKYKFGSYAGKIKEIAKLESVEGSIMALVESNDGGLANIIITKDTYILNNVEVKVGDEITGYFNANAPMLMIYPAQYKADVVVVADNSNKCVKVDIFNKDLISSDNWLKLNVSDKTEIVKQDGSVFKGELADRRLVVIYDISTKSIPAQTQPIKIIVLSEKEVSTANNPIAKELIVNGKKLDAPAAYANGKGIVMVPLRVISEALGYEVTWNNETKSIGLGKGISLKIGEDNYIYMKTAPIKLGSAPEIKDSKTYVPLSFFREVVKMNNAYSFEGQIVIDNKEKMQ